jgi:hypothetical protein
METSEKKFHKKIGEIPNSPRRSHYLAVFSFAHCRQGIKKFGDDWLSTLSLLGTY